MVVVVHEGRSDRPLSDARHNLQFGNGRCTGHAKPQFNYYTRVNWLAGSTVTRNGVQIDLGGPLSIDLSSPSPCTLDINPLIEITDTNGASVFPETGMTRCSSLDAMPTTRYCCI